MGTRRWESLSKGDGGENGVAASNETQPIDSPQSVATARKTSAPLAAHAQDNALANKYVNHPCNYDKIIEDGTEGQPIQSCQNQRGQCQFQTKSSLFIQEVELTKKSDIGRDVRGLATKRPDDEEQKMGLAGSPSFGPDRIAVSGNVIDATSHIGEEWEWVNHPTEV